MPINADPRGVETVPRGGGKYPPQCSPAIYGKKMLVHVVGKALHHTGFQYNVH